MKVCGLTILDGKGLTNIDIYRYVNELMIPDFRGVFMRDTLPKVVTHKGCGIVNLNTSHQAGSHWVSFFKDGMNRRTYFDSFSQITPVELQKYLKTKKEFETGKVVIQRNTDIVQHVNVCGHLVYLFVLTSLTREHLPYNDVLNKLNDGYTQADW